LDRSKTPSLVLSGIKPEPKRDVITIPFEESGRGAPIAQRERDPKDEQEKKSVP
jgi:hypothetical protein